MERRGGRGIWKACVLGDDAPCGSRAALSPGQEENSPGESSQSIPAGGGDPQEAAMVTEPAEATRGAADAERG